MRGRQRGPPARDALSTFLDRYEREKADRKLNGRIFLACFSAARDKASQWLRYADEGRGICLGVRVLVGEAPADGVELGTGLLEVDYVEASRRLKIEAAFSAVCGEANKFALAGDVGSARSLCLSALLRIAAHAETTAKDAKYAEEEEWRLVGVVRRQATPRICRRERNSKAIRYLELEARSLGQLIELDEIILGPNQEGDRDAGHHRLNAILDAAGYADAQRPPINYSACPVDGR